MGKLYLLKQKSPSSKGVKKQLLSMGDGGSSNFTENTSNIQSHCAVRFTGCLLVA